MGGGKDRGGRFGRRVRDRGGMLWEVKVGGKKGRMYGGREVRVHDEVR